MSWAPCGKCGKAVTETVTPDGWHEFACGCGSRSYIVDPYDRRKMIRRDAPTTTSARMQRGPTAAQSTEDAND